MTTPQDRTSGAGPRNEELAERAIAWFVRMRSGGASDADRQAFAQWLDGDVEHAKAYAEAESLWSELGAVPDPRPSAATATARPAETGHAGSGRVASLRFFAAARRRDARSGWYAAVVASFLLAASFGFWVTDGFIVLRADHVTAVGETRSVTLADGSVLQLNTDSALAVDFSDRRRGIRLLRGEAYFTVARESGRPFEVEAGGGVTRAVGTAFVVRRSDGAVEVAVSEGRVRVEREVAGRAGDERAARDGLVLRAGEAASYTPERIARHFIDVGFLATWREGRLVFADRTLGAVVEDLDRYRPGAILFLDSALAETRFTGVFGLKDTDQALEAIESTLPIDVIRITPYLTLLRAR